MNHPRTPHIPCRLPRNMYPRKLALAALCAAATLAPQALADNWDQNAAPGEQVDYVRLEEIRSFYKFNPDTYDRRNGTRSAGNGHTTLTFGPDSRALNIHGVNSRLTHPTRTNERGELLVSKTDVVKLIDPVLRPTYITKRREVKCVVIDPGHGGHDVGHQTAQVREADCTLALARQLATQLRERGYEAILTREDNQYLSDQRRIDKANAAENAIFLSLHLNSGRSDYHGIETYTVTPYSPPAAPPQPASDTAAENTPSAEPVDATAAGSPAPAAENPEPAATPATDAPAPAAPPASPLQDDDTLGVMPGNEQDCANIALAFALQSSLTTTTGAQDGGCRRARYSLLSSVRCPAAIVELGYATHAEEGAALNTEEYRALLATAIANGVDSFARAIKPGATPPVIAPPPPPAPTPVQVEKPAGESSKKADSNKSSKKNAGKGGKTIRKSKGRSRDKRSNWKRSSNKRTGRKR